MSTTAIQEIHVGDAGLAFVVTIRDDSGPVDLTNATSVQFFFQKPDGSMLVVPATVSGDPALGTVRYTTAATDLDQAGTWMHQVYAEIGPDQKYSNINRFKVYPNLPLGA